MLATTVLSLSALVAGILAQSTSTTSPTPSPSVYANNSQQFLLRTDLKEKDPDKARFDDLWLYSYHTGAGLSDVTFSKNKTPYAAKAWVNYTDDGTGQLTFALNGPYPWTMLAESSSYRMWNPMHINVGQGGNSGYFVNNSGLIWNTAYKGGLNTTYSSFSTWLVCDWWYSKSPQLFWKSRYDVESETLCNCAEVYLCPEYF